LNQIDEKNLDEILPLIRKYQEFYQVKNIDDEKNKEFFSQFGISSDKGCLFGYRKNGKLAAFATVYFSYALSLISKVAILNDLYTSEDYRNQGIATRLIKHCGKYAKENSAVRLQWVTAASNKIAQSIYKALGAKQSSWEFFTYAT